MTSASRPSRSSANRPDPERRSVILEQSPDSRNALLLALHSRLFGSRIDSVSHCPACGAAAEFAGDCDALVEGLRPPEDVALPLSLEACGYVVDFRLPVSTDIVVASRAVDADDDDPMRGARPLQRVTRLDRSATKAAVAPSLDTRPLSDAAMAGRIASEKRAPDEIVHVTIGRIDCLQRDGRGRP